jgi:competence protein ComEC
LPTVRTLLMIAAVLLAQLLRAAPAARKSLALALLAVLCADPLSVLAPGSG